MKIEKKKYLIGKGDYCDYNDISTCSKRLTSQQSIYRERVQVDERVQVTFLDLLNK